MASCWRLRIGDSAVRRCALGARPKLEPKPDGDARRPLLGEWLRLRQCVGLVLGAAGVGLVVGAGGVSAPRAGTLHYARFCRDVPLLPDTAVHFLSASAVCAALTFLFETPHVTWTGTSVTALLWNAGPVSFGGMALYFVMRTRGMAGRPTSNFYLVPGVTGLMAWLFLGEGVSLPIMGLVTASIGCFLVSAPRPGYGRRFISEPAPRLFSRHAVGGAEICSEAVRGQSTPSGGQLRDA
jgi:drug/metabolite transporter (DMT)-like permease